MVIIVPFFGVRALPNFIIRELLVFIHHNWDN